MKAMVGKGMCLLWSCIGECLLGESEPAAIKQEPLCETSDGGAGGAVGFRLGFTQTHHSLGTNLCLPPVSALPVLSSHEDMRVVAFPSGPSTQGLL